jgi:fatty acid desaturase
LIRHGRWRLTKAAAVFPLAVAMIELPFGALLVAAIGAPPLLAAGLLAALVATVAVSAIAMRADEENRVAALTQAKPLPQNRFAMNHRHASSRAGLDNGSGPVAG